MKPLIAAAVFGVLMMFASLNVKEKRNLSNFANILFLILLGINIWEFVEVYKHGASIEAFKGMIIYSPLSVWFNTLIVALSLFYSLYNARGIERVGVHVGEYYSLIFFMLVGAHLLSVYNHVLILFLGIEIISIPQYILAGADKRNLKSSEASLKYFLMGAFSTGITLMGLTLLFGGTGTFELNAMDFSEWNYMMLTGVIFLLISFGFKVSAAPMHIWTPDVYDGAPTAFAGFMATVVKASIFMAFVNIFIHFYELKDVWQALIAIVIVLTLLIGNITAVYQQSVKRMLAYSSIAQSGFMLFAVYASDAIAVKGIVLYAIAYTLATLMLFGVLSHMKDQTYDGFNGLSKKEPFVAFALTIALLSLTGIPLTAGFFAKFYMLQAAFNTGIDYTLYLVLFALLMSAVSVYYYFRLIWAMYFKIGNPILNFEISKAQKAILALGLVLIIVVGIYPDVLFFFL